MRVEITLHDACGEDRSRLQEILNVFGPVRLMPGGHFRDAVREAYLRKPVSPKLQWYAARVDEQVSAWAGDAVLAVKAADDVAATTLTAQAVALLRLLVRRAAAVNPDIHKIGLADEVVSRLRETVVIQEDGTVGLGWKRLDGGVSFTISEERIDGWLADPVIRYLGDQLVPDATCKKLGLKARTAVGVLDRAFVSTEPVEMVLFATVALETLLSADQPQGEYKAQSIPIARRVALSDLPGRPPCDRARLPVSQGAVDEGPVQRDPRPGS